MYCLLVKFMPFHKREDSKLAATTPPQTSPSSDLPWSVPTWEDLLVERNILREAQAAPGTRLIDLPPSFLLDALNTTCIERVTALDASDGDGSFPSDQDRTGAALEAADAYFSILLKTFQHGGLVRDTNEPPPSRVSRHLDPLTVAPSSRQISGWLLSAMARFGLSGLHDPSFIVTVHGMLVRDLSAPVLPRNAVLAMGRTADERLTRGPKDWSSPFFFLSWMKTLILCTVNPSIFASDRASLQCAARRAVAELPSLRQRDSGWQLVHLFRFGHVQLLAEYGEGIVTEETVVMAEEVFEWEKRFDLGTEWYANSSRQLAMLKTSVATWKKTGQLGILWIK